MSEGPRDNTGNPGDAPTGDQVGRVDGAGNRVVVDVLAYLAARLLLALVLTGVIYGIARLLGITQFPLVIAALFALIIAMPLGIAMFGPLRRRATASLAIAGARRRREREQLQARLHGDVGSDEASDG